jgi:hypothetical protein
MTASRSSSPHFPHGTFAQHILCVRQGVPYHDDHWTRWEGCGEEIAGQGFPGGPGRRGVNRCQKEAGFLDACLFV